MYRLFISPRLTLGALLLFVTLLSACSSSPEKETKRWTELQAQHKTVIASYPQWQPVLKSDMATATKMWKSAQTLADPKAQVTAMKTANDYLNAIPSKLREIKSKIDSNNRQRRELNNLRVGGVQNDRRNQALASIDTTNQEVQTAILKSPKITHEEALLFLGTQTQQLTRVSSNNRRIIKRFKKKRRPKKSSTAKRSSSSSKSKSKRPAKKSKQK